jgi:hypothetical protein
MSKIETQSREIRKALKNLNKVIRSKSLFDDPEITGLMDELSKLIKDHDGYILFEKFKLDALSERQRKKNDDESKRIDEIVNKRILELLDGSVNHYKQDRDIKEKLKLNNRRENITQEVILENITDFINEGNLIDDKIQRANNIVLFSRNTAIKLTQEKSKR